MNLCLYILCYTSSYKMPISISKTVLFLLFVTLCFNTFVEANQQNKSLHHVRRSSMEDSFFKNQKQGSYRSYQPVSIKYHKTYPRADDRTDYDITSYDTEYGGVVSNFTSSIYDDNPPLYPNPEDFPKNNIAIKTNNKAENEVELPDDSLADADLKEHNIIDSVTYLYGFNNCHGLRNEWIILIFITSAITIILLLAAMMWLIWSQYAAEFRKNSKIYPVIINLCCCLVACTLIYIQAVMGVSSPSQCERIALLLHYTYLTCATWIVTLAAAVSEYCACDTFMPLKYNYLLAYGVPAIVVMFNYALSMEHYEIKHYCWMSLEKGMVMGFMVPVMMLIIINTGIIMLGLKNVHRKQSKSLQSKVQELLERHELNYMNELLNDNNGHTSADTFDSIYIAGSSRKNTDSSETLDKDNSASEDNCQYVNMGIPNEGITEERNDSNNQEKVTHVRGQSMVYMDHVWMKWNWKTEGNEMKTYLNLCLVMEPFFAINWVMGVVAIENAAHWSTPTIYLILALTMYVYFTATISMTLPMIRIKTTTSLCCEDIVGEPAIIVRTKTTDSIPLLDPAVQQPNVTLAPTDTISTISI